MKYQVFCLCACIAFIGCKNGKGEEEPPMVCDHPVSFTAVTYNAGLAPGFVALSTPRIPAVAEAAGSLDVDLLCLQEVWTEKAANAVGGALEESGMMVFTHDTTGMGETGDDRCTIEEIQPAAECALKECSGLPKEDVSDCVVEKCTEAAVVMYFYAPKCLNCVIAQPGRSVDEIISVCVDGPGASRLYGGRNSMILASRHEMRDKEAMDLPSSGANRVALMATVIIGGVGKVEVGCVHLSADGPIPPTHPGFITWDSEREAQFRMVSDRLDERAQGRPTLLLGDMNFGKANGAAVKANNAELWGMTEELGFFSPAADADPPLCSACLDNSVSTGEEGEADSLIDHVFTRDIGSVFSAWTARRYFDQKVGITGHDGDPVMTHPSDHYGVGVTFTCGE